MRSATSNNRNISVRFRDFAIAFRKGFSALFIIIVITNGLTAFSKRGDHTQNQ